MRLPERAVRRFADINDPRSAASRLRRKRLRLFESFIEPLPRPVRILDLGGTNEFWERGGWAGRAGVFITTLNPTPEAQSHANVRPLVGDAVDLARFEDRAFDVVFSNSVIEHLSTLENQRRMAAEVQRVGRVYWVQTPNFWFPIEPHFLVPGWQWMPVGLRVALLRHSR